MSEPDCFWNPEDPRCCDGVLCPVEPEKEDGGKMDGGDHDMDHKDDDDMGMMMKPWTGQVAYLVIAAMMTTRAGLNLFRYEKGNKYTD